MATVKKSKKKLIVWIVIIAIIISGVTGSIVYTSVNKGKQEVSLNTIGTSSITQTVSSTGEVTAGLSREYKAGSVATVKQVFVKLGDEVKKGETLATFDTTSMDAQVASLNSAYKSASTSYNEAVANQSNAAKQLKSVNKQIKALEKKIAKLNGSNVATTTTTTTTTKKAEQTTATTTTNANTSFTFSTTKKPSTTKATTVEKCTGTHNYKYNGATSSKSASGHTVRCTVCDDIITVDHDYSVVVSSKTTDDYHVVRCSVCGYEKYEVHKFSGSGSSAKCTICNRARPSIYSETDAQIAIAMVYVAQLADQFEKLGAAAEQIAEMKITLEQLAKDLADVAENVNTMTIIFSTISEEVMKQFAAGNFSSDKIAAAVGKAVSEAIKDGMVEFIDNGAAVQMIETALKNVNWKAIGKGISESDAFQLTAAQIQIAALYAQQEVYTVTSAASTVNAQKEVVSTTKNAYETMKAARDELANGWKADFDGVITACDISNGGQATALQTGIKLENMDKRVVTISLGEYDVHKVKVGMEAKVKTAYGEYAGVLESIAPTATGGSSGSVLDSVGSMAGISGLSSLTASGAGVECKILVDEPDENIIIGFDADVTITTGNYTDVPCVPIESIVLEKEGTYVYLYNEEDETVTKTKITTGATSDTAYQITSGLNIGQKIVATPATNYKSDTFKVKVVDKK